jgi:hypothetical protein
MNKSKQPLFGQMRKKMAKAIKDARSLFLSEETRQYQDEQTAIELRKKFPRKKPSRKQQALAKALKVKKENKALAIEGILATKMGKSSKRTTPGHALAGMTESSPASPHKEGARWIKNSTKQMLNQRTIQNHHGAQKK